MTDPIRPYGDITPAPRTAMSRTLLILVVSVFFLGWMIDLSFADGLVETLFLAGGLAVFMCTSIALGALCERYRK